MGRQKTNVTGTPDECPKSEARSVAKRAMTTKQRIPTSPAATACGRVDDAELLRRLARDVDGAFEPLLLAYQHRLYALALRLCGNAQDAEEITQDTFVQAYRALGGYAPERIAALRLRPWLYQIAVNRWRNQHRRHTLPARSLDTSPLSVADGDTIALPTLAETLADSDLQAQPEAALDGAETRELLAAQVAALPPHLRLAVVLRHVEGMSYPEIAAMVKQPIGTVKSHAHRGVAQLRAALTREPAFSAHEVYL